MNRTHVICPLVQIPVAERRNMVVGNRTLAVFHLHGGAVYARYMTAGSTFAPAPAQIAASASLNSVSRAR